MGVSDDLIRHKFIQALPITIAAVLTTQKDLTITQLGKLADELSPLMSKPCHQVAPVSSSRPNHLFPNSDRSNHFPMGLRPFNGSQRPRICRAHIYFASHAKTCKPWCQWPNKPFNIRINPSSRSTSPAPDHQMRPSSRSSSPAPTPHTNSSPMPSSSTPGISEN